MQAYLVGGAVRDELLGLEVKDRDWVVVGATPKQMLAQGFTQVGSDFPVFLHPKTREEYALARTERKQGHGYHGFSVYSAPDVTLEEDLLRRDLTINAMARSEQGELTDPFGGRADLEARELRHVSEAFKEDPLRIIRTARFAARFQPLGFTVCAETMALMRTMVAAGEVEHLVPERVWQEIQRALHEQSPVTFFQVMRDCGALAVLIPELSSEDNFSAALETLQCVHSAEGSTAERFAALLCALDERDCTSRAKALKAPNDCQQLARLAAAFLPEIGKLDLAQPDAGHLLELLENADLWRRPERFSSLLSVLGCALGAGSQKRLEPLESAADSAQGVDPKTLMEKGFSGKELGEAIRSERLARIAQAVSSPTS
ncbi:multifunctional CCA tRNA nucleotidyl transferase/2'3'-cyclic phosphodiesterase/2'nucleotidase/phosphatase [Marinobacter sp. 1_MG-2023]|uniref:multifunctional CCA tRNA nucleotidyl transferase/2'3'-cyclic phosphodiesterase/2'nucleotidase/phosphatase n=1 Tax=Marinobacter sp. 1_MG-2023 TaxID=3062627 RepID=UPI0026E36DE7|nr:multifunctional CCA tRNA nucleotidyl transferase/2'3'-cyclic phosphodiesterase/2'nucleotidase/phosphatase [Marinobacter sp. 1_MG-2023]MDO6822707.1 multifunctional CCA tRNA nucleotidyl transferase/2'3'-cyclic phosphodiesterase/2'nucleotidase/phosphatase [Marinobacter sp. 1_MG-2023]